MSDTNTMTIAQAASRLGLKQSTIETYTNQGRLVRTDKGRILTASVEAYDHKRNPELSKASKRAWKRNNSKPAQREVMPRIEVKQPALKAQVMQHTYILEGMLRGGASETIIRRYLSEFRDQVLS